MTKLLVRTLFCLASLCAAFTIFTAPAALQSNTAANGAVVVNANLATRSPRPTPRRRAPSAVNTRAANIGPVADAPTPPEPPANSTVRGRVYYADTGRAVKRASVTLMNDRDGPVRSPSGLTDADGNFQLKNVRAGTYYAMINAPGVVSPLAFFDFSARGAGGNERDAMANAFSGFEKIVVDGLTDLDVQIPARRGGAIGGRITYDDGDAAIGVKVEILRKAEDKFVSVIPNLSTIFSMRDGGFFQTDDRGVYRFSGLPPGEYVVKVTESARHSDNAERRNTNPFDEALIGSPYLTIFYPDAWETKTAQLIGVDYGQEIEGINLTIPSRRLFKLEGRVVARKDGTPVKARITLGRETSDRVYTIFDEIGGSRRQPALTDEDGRYRFKELPKGEYKLVVEPVESESEYLAARGDYANANAAAVVREPAAKFSKKSLVVSLEDKDVTDFTIELGTGGTVTGTVTVENSQELPRSLNVQAVSVEGELTVSDSLHHQEPAVYGGNANYVPPKPDRDFRLEAVAEGRNYFHVLTGGDDYYVKSATAGGVDLLAAPFEIKEGERLANVRIVLGRDTGTLKGKVLDEAREPARRLALTLVPTDARRRNPSFYREARTDEDGAFETRLAPGEYAVVFVDRRAGANLKFEEYFKLLDELVKAAPTVRIEAGRTENLTINRKK